MPTTYTTKPGQRWDQVSMDCYGQPDKYDLIINENISEVRDMLEAGGIVTRIMILTVPDLPDDSTGLSELPPWRFA